MRGKKTDDRLIHESCLFQIRELTLQTDDGQQHRRDLVVHPGAALVLPVTNDGSIVMIRNYRFAISRTLWELPCGTLEDSEEPLSCAARELTEETGYAAGWIKPLCEFYSCPGFVTEKIYGYLAGDLTAGQQALDETEEIEIEVLADSTVRQMVDSNEIMDAKTLAALNIYWSRKVE